MDNTKDIDADEPTADRPWWTDAVKEVANAGLTTLFMTEDSIRSYLRDKKLPVELVSDLMDGISRKKKDLYGSLAQEVGKVFAKIDITREVTRFLEEHRISFEGKVSFEPKTSKNKDERTHEDNFDDKSS